jgi:hypothetical protein
MSLAGNALVAIWNDIAPEMREDFFEWHPREHMVERLGIPGFLRGRRYAAVDAEVEFLTLYELTGTDVLVSEIYKKRLTNPTPWSTKTLPHFRNNVRGACRIHYTDGVAMGGVIHTTRLQAQEGRERELIESLARDVMPQLCALPRVTGAHLVENDASLTAGNAGNQRGRVISLPHLVILIEGSTAEGVKAVARELLDPKRLQAFGARGEIVQGLYQLEYSIQNLVGAAA